MRLLNGKQESGPAQGPYPRVIVKMADGSEAMYAASASEVHAGGTLVLMMAPDDESGQWAALLTLAPGEWRSATAQGYGPIEAEA